MKVQEEITSFVQFLNMLHEAQPGRELNWTPEGFSNGTTLYQSADLNIEWMYRFLDELDPDDVSMLYIVKSTDGFVGYTRDVYGLNCSSGKVCEDSNHVTELLETHDATAYEKEMAVLPDVNLNAINLSEMIKKDDPHNNLVDSYQLSSDPIIHIQFGDGLKRAV